MVTSKQLHRLATRSADMLRFQLTGRLPQGMRPASPLITLLERLPPHERLRYRGVTIDQRLGYTGSRRFHNAAQALHWLKPAEEVFEACHAESWRDKRFSRRLTLADLAACCAQTPTTNPNGSIQK